MNQGDALKIMKSGENCFITGRAGTGKTYVLNKFIEYLKKKKIPAGLTASTGIAATHINGQTLHSWVGLGICNKYDKGVIKKAINSSSIQKKIEPCQVLIIDEVSMFHSFQLDMTDIICRGIKGSDEPFGGIQVIICGDFFQLPPVSRDNKVSEFITDSAAWDQLKLNICYLEKTYRQEQDEPLLDLLNEIRANEVSEYNFERLMSRKDYKFPENITPTVLYTHNVDVDSYNDRRLNEIKAKEHTFEMRKIGNKKSVEKLAKNCLASENLVLKKGAIVMFLKNNLRKGYVNGTTGKVVSFNEENLPVVKIFKTGKKVTVVPDEWAMEENLKTTAQLIQIPLKLAWAITIHKSQGMTLDYAQVDLSRAFTYSLGYVALSRIRSIESLTLKGFNSTSLKVSEESIKIDKFLKKAAILIG